MAGTTPLTIGADVSCTDGVCGKLSRLVMELRARTVTHLVVSDRQFQGRLAPLSLVDADPDSSYDQVRWHGTGWLADPPSVTYDTLPAGEVGVRGGEPVHATDGNIGQIQGLVIDSASSQVTHVLLQEGHVFGRKVVAIPIAAVTGADENGMQLNITKQQVKDLPSGWHRSPG
jgi:sporulation protein YlmC with PRC-barrel domain